MHYIITAIIIISLSIVLSIGISSNLYYYLVQIPSATISSIQDKIIEIIDLLLDKRSVVYGVSTGDFIIKSIKMNSFIIRVSLPEGDQFISINKTALLISKLSLTIPYNDDKIAIIPLEEGTIIIPKPYIDIAITEELGIKTYIIKLSIISIQEGFSALGVFNIKKIEKIETLEISRNMNKDGIFTFYIDEEQKTSFLVKSGEKIRIIINYKEIQLLQFF
ncbi:MAG: hypothetical protein LM593_04800 [Candidatus Verstraetearchaeota archaeon]|nr:hypothetical protein [Candidatus Verstraetearchaeota archaeon]